MKNTRIILIISILVNFGIGLFTNYASEEVPEFLRQNPFLIWLTLFLMLFALLLLELVNSRRIYVPAINRNRKTKMGKGIYDVFISYSHKDRDWVKNVLLKELEDRGFKVGIDFRDFDGGAFTLDAIEELVEKSNHVVAVFSPDYSQSEWGKLETVLARTLDPAQRKRKLIPVLYRDTKLSLGIRAINYIDLRNPSPEKWEQLTTSIM